MAIKLPDNLVYFLQKPSKRTSFDGTVYDVYPAFPADAASAAQLKTGKEWAKGWGNKQFHSEIALPNTPFRGLTILSLEERGEGGRAYKVITKEGYMFDMRESTLVDVLGYVGIRAGGYIDAEFQWIVDGSQKRLVRTGSKEYLEGVKQKTSSIEFKNLEFGKTYRDAKNDDYVFYGYIFVPDKEPDRVTDNNILTVTPASGTKYKKVGLFIRSIWLRKTRGEADRIYFDTKQSGKFVLADEQIKIPFKNTEEALDFYQKDMRKVFSAPMPKARDAYASDHRKYSSYGGWQVLYAELEKPKNTAALLVKWAGGK